MLQIIEKAFAYGNLGILVEFWFTGLHSLWTGNKKGTGHSYVAMFLVYIVAGFVLEWIRFNLDWHFFWKAFVYVPVIYAIEFFSGLTMLYVLGVVPWRYPKSKWAPLELVRIDYAIFWFVLALAFEPIAVVLHRVVDILKF